MSQIIKDMASGPVPPDVPTTFSTDSGNAVPAANILNVLGADTTVNNDNGIRTTGSGNTVTVQLTNRSTGQVTTANATPTTILSFALGATPGVYYFRGSLQAYNTTDIAGGAYDFSAGARTTGAAGTELGTEYKDVFEEVAMTTADFNVTVSANNLVIEVIGIAAKTINWNIDLTYRFVS